MNQCFGNAILKWICILVFAFLVFLIVATVLAYQQGAFAAYAYEFVKCPGDDNTYPEGTKCNGYANIDDDDEDEEDESTEQEEEAMKEAAKEDDDD